MKIAIQSEVRPAIMFTLMVSSASCGLFPMICQLRPPQADVEHRAQSRPVIAGESETLKMRMGLDIRGMYG